MEWKTVNELIEYCESKGMRLWTEGGKLKYKGPDLFLKSGILTDLREHKEELLRCLESRGEELKRDLAHRFEAFPMTDVQSAYVLGRSESFAYGGVACHNYMELRYEKLEENRVKEIWNRLVKRHDMLRALMHEDGIQEVLPQVPPLEIPVSGPEGLESTRQSMRGRMYPLGKWPMFGLALTQMEEESILHFSIEFLIADWASVRILLSEFETLYENPDAQLPEIGIGFRDYVLHEKKSTNSPEKERSEKYWEERITTLPPAPGLPVNKEEEAEKLFFRKSLHLNRDEWTSLKTFAAKCGITPTSLVLTAYSDTLRRWSSEKSFTLNMTVLNRKKLHRDIYRVVGDFTTLSLLEVEEPEKGELFSARAKRIQRMLFESLDHGEVSGVELMRRLQRSRGREAALMPYVFTSAIGLMNTPIRGRFEGEGISETPQVFIDCQAMDSEDGLRINWDMRSGVFPDKMAEDMFSSFEKELRMLLTGKAEEACSTLPDDQIREREEANRSEGSFVSGLIHEGFLRQAELRKDALALRDAEGSFTYGEADRLARRIASHLLRSGLRKGESVGIWMKKGKYQAVACLGILYAGGVYVPLDAGEGGEKRRLSVLKNSSARFVLRKSGEEGVLPEPFRCIWADRLEDEAELPLPVSVDPSSPCYIIFTSGSTGEPKGVVITHEAAHNTILDVNRRCALTEKDRVLALSKLNFDLSVYDMFGLLGSGGAVIYPEDEAYMDADAWRKCIKEENITVWNSVPALLSLLLEDLKLRGDQEKLPLRAVLLSGDRIPPTLPRDILPYTNQAKILCMGGATEAAIWSILHEYQEGDSERASIPYGIPMEHQFFRILDSEGLETPVGVVGELYIGGRGLAEGYIGDPALTETKFACHFKEGERLYRTGDLGRYLPGGEIEFMGRIDHQVKIRGFRIELGEIAHAYETSPFIHQAVAGVDTKRKDLPIQLVAELERREAPSSDDLFFGMAEKAEKEAEEKLLQKDSSFSYEEEKRLQDEASTLTMLYGLERCGLKSVRFPLSKDEVLGEGILPKYQSVVRHWLCFLKERNCLTEENGRFVLPHTSYSEVEDAWNRALSAWKESFGHPDSVQYFRNSALAIVSVLRGETDPMSILYPDGSERYPNSLYIDHAAAKLMTSCFCSMVREKAKSFSGRKLRILEIGGGTGATTRFVLKELENVAAEYSFTDISKYFFKAAEERFGSFPGFSIREFNLDEDAEEQGFHENSYDIILAAYVLNNVKDSVKALQSMEKLLAPGGLILFSEPLGEEPNLMISQSFLMTEAEDEERESRPFLGREGWMKAMEKLSYDKRVCVLGEHGEASRTLQAGLYAIHGKRDFVEMNREELQKEVISALPNYMIPKEVRFVTSLPKTANGKIDREKAFSIFRETEEAVREEKKEDESPLVKQLLLIWKDVLKTEDLSSEDSLYDYGADSLIMAQSVTRIKHEIATEHSFDVLLRHLLNHPSVKALADFLEEEKKEEGGEDRPTSFLSVKSHGGNKEKGLRVLLHGALGTTECYRHLIPELLKLEEREIITIGIADMKQYGNIPSGELMERLADLYAGEILKREPSSVAITGYSFSGSLAIETARRLSENGIEVSDLSVIDGGTLPIRIEEDVIYEILFLDSRGLSLKELSYETENLMEKAFRSMNAEGEKVLRTHHFLNAMETREDRERWTALLGKTEDNRMKLYEECFLEKRGEKTDAASLKNYVHVYRHSFEALTYLPDLYFGDIQYLSTRDRVGAYRHFEVLIEEWKEICIGDFTLTQVPGDHYSCLEKKENAAVLARVLTGGSAEDSEKIPDEAFLREAREKSDTLVFLCMLNHFFKKGVFREKRPYSEEEILGLTNCIRGHRPVLKRWIRELLRNGYLRKEGEGFLPTRTVSDEDVARAFREREESWKTLGDQKSSEYLKKNIEELDSLIQGKSNANLILFPGGSTEYAEALYKDTFIFLHLNRRLAEEALQIGTRLHGGHILELGAGVGASSDPLIRALTEKGITPFCYLYTDLSRFFLNSAEKRYADITYMKYACMDVNKDLLHQGAGVDHYDLVLANGVLNNSVHIGKTLSSIRRVLKKDGLLCIMEPVGESMEILVSQAFMMNQAEDERQDENRTFMTKEEWEEAFRTSGWEILRSYPEEDSPLCIFDQKLYILRPKEL